MAVGVEFSPRDRHPKRAVSREPHALVQQVAAVVESVGPQRAARVDHAAAHGRHIDELGGLGDPLQLLVAEAKHKTAGLLGDDAAPSERRWVGLVHVLEHGLLGVIDDPRDAVTQHGMRRARRVLVRGQDAVGEVGDRRRGEADQVGRGVVVEVADASAAVILHRLENPAMAVEEAQAAAVVVFHGVEEVLRAVAQLDAVAEAVADRRERDALGVGPP